MIQIRNNHSRTVSRIQIFLQVYMCKIRTCAGMLDSDEFALAMHLMNIKLDGKENELSSSDHLLMSKSRILYIGLNSHQSTNFLSLIDLYVYILYLFYCIQSISKMLLFHSFFSFLN